VQYHIPNSDDFPENYCASEFTVQYALGLDGSPLL